MYWPNWLGIMHDGLGCGINFTSYCKWSRIQYSVLRCNTVFNAFLFRVHGQFEYGIESAPNSWPLCYVWNLTRTTLWKVAMKRVQGLLDKSWHQFQFNGHLKFFWWATTDLIFEAEGHELNNAGGYKALFHMSVASAPNNYPKRHISGHIMDTSKTHPGHILDIASFYILKWGHRTSKFGHKDMRGHSFYRVFHVFRWYFLVKISLLLYQFIYYYLFRINIQPYLLLIIYLGKYYLCMH